MEGSSLKKPDSRLGSDSNFYLFWLLALSFSVVVSMVLVGHRADKIFLDFQSETSSIQSKLIAEKIDGHLSTRLQLLTQLSQDPLVANGVMGTGSSKDNLIDLLDDYGFLGKREKIWVYDVAGQLVYQNDLSNGRDDSLNEVSQVKEPEAILNEKWFDELVNNGKEFIIRIYTEKREGEASKHYFDLILPINYNGFAEGVLKIRLQESVEEILETDDSSLSSFIILKTDNTTFSNIDDSNLYSLVNRYTLPRSKLDYQFFVFTDALQQDKYQLLRAVLLSVLFSLIISFSVLVFFGKQFLLNPFKRLIDSEQKVRESEDRFLRAVNGSNDGIWDWDVDHEKMYFSERLWELLEYSGAETEKRPSTNSELFQLLHPDDQNRLMSGVKAHLAYGENFDLEVRLQSRSGMYIYFRVRGKAVRDSNMHATRMSGSLTDITDYKQSQKALRKSKERNDLLAKAIESSPVGVSIADNTQEDMPIIYVNQAFTDMTMYTKDDVLGTNCRFLQGEETDPAAVDQIRAAIKNAKDLRVELLNYTKNGRKFWNALHMSPVFDEQNNLTAFVGVQQDITAQKNLESAQEQARQAAVEANKAKSEFLASMSHEIRTPMNGVLGMLRLLQNSDMNSDQYHKVDLAMTSAQSLLTLINDILDFSKVDAGKMDLELVDFDLQEMLSSFAEASAYSAQSKNIELIVDTTKMKSTWVKGDSGRIRQIITNIVGNAIKFTEEGHVLLDVSANKVTGSSSNSEQYIDFRCNVIDTGIGIPKDKVATLFDSFTQVDASTTRKYGGTGLGLAIAKKLSEIMQGDITIHSEEGKGSCFEISLKLQVSDTDSLESNVTDTQIAMLVLDTNEMSGQAISGYLSRQGIQSEIHIMSNMGSLLGHTFNDNHVYAGAILDYRLLDGQIENSTQVLSHLNLSPKAFIALMTGIGFDKGLDVVKNHNMHSYFPKPVINQDIISTVQALKHAQDSGEAVGKTEEVRDQSKGGNEGVSEQLKQLRVLLAEDNQINQFVAVQLLEEMGITLVDTAADGVEVLDLLKRAETDTHYGVVLMDCQMPEMDGYEATRAIRKGEAGEYCKSISIIAMTANAMRGDKEKCIEAGMDDYVSKPVEPEFLLEKIKETLNLAKG